MANEYINGEGSQQNIGGKTEITQGKQVKSGQYLTDQVDRIADSGADAVGKLQQRGPDLSHLSDTSGTISKVWDVVKAGSAVAGQAIHGADAAKWDKQQASVTALRERAATEGWSKERIDREVMTMVDTFEADDFITDKYQKSSDQRRVPLVEAKRTAQLGKIEKEEAAAASIAADKLATLWDEAPDSFEASGGSSHAPALSEITGRQGQTIYKPDVTAAGSSHEATMSAAEYGVSLEYGVDAIADWSQEKYDRVVRKYYNAMLGPIKKRRAQARQLERASAVDAADVVGHELEPEIVWDVPTADDYAGGSDGGWAVTDEYADSLRHVIDAPKANGASPLSEAERSTRAAARLQMEIQKVLENTSLSLEERQEMIDTLKSNPMWSEYLTTKQLDELDESYTTSGVADGSTQDVGGQRTPVPNIYTQGLKEMEDELSTYLETVGVDSDLARMNEIVEDYAGKLGISKGEPGSPERDMYEQLQAASKAAMAQHSKNIESRKAQIAGDTSTVGAANGVRLTPDETNGAIDDSKVFGPFRVATGFDVTGDLDTYAQDRDTLITTAQSLNAMPGLRVGDSTTIVDFVRDAIHNRQERPAQYAKALMFFHNLSPSQRKSLAKGLGDATLVTQLRSGESVARESQTLNPSAYTDPMDPLVTDDSGMKVDDAGNIIYDMDSEDFTADSVAFTEAWESIAPDHPLGDSVDDSWYGRIWDAEGKPNLATINNDPVMRQVFQRARDLNAGGLSWEKALGQTFDELNTEGGIIVTDEDGMSTIMLDPHEHVEFGHNSPGNKDDVGGSLDRHIETQLGVELDRDARTQLAEEWGVDLPDRGISYREGLQRAVAQRLNERWGTMSKAERTAVLTWTGMPKEFAEKAEGIQISWNDLSNADWNFTADTRSARSRTFMDDPDGGMPVGFFIPGLGADHRLFPGEQPMFLLTRRYGAGTPYVEVPTPAEGASTEDIDKASPERYKPVYTPDSEGARVGGPSYRRDGGTGSTSKPTRYE